MAEGKFTRVNGVPVIDPEKVPGLLTLIPVPKNPHGCNVTPDGKYVLASGKLSPTVTIIDAKTLKVIAEPEVGLGPLHTTFDDRGNAYTSLFVDSQIVKWNIEKAIKSEPDYIIDRVDVHYNVGHTKAAGADTSHPSGDWLISLNKLSKGMFLPVGPAMPESQELIDISGDKDAGGGCVPLPSRTSRRGDAPSEGTRGQSGPNPRRSAGGGENGRRKGGPEWEQSGRLHDLHPVQVRAGAVRGPRRATRSSCT